MDPSIASVLDDDDHLLDSHVWRAVVSRRKDSSYKKIYANVVTGKTFEFLSPDQKRNFTDEEVAHLQQVYKRNAEKNRGTLFASRFAVDNIEKITNEK